MNNELKELVSKADQGDKNAQKQLMQLAQEKQDAGEYEEAAELFKLGAMAYRIAASFEGSLVDDEKMKSYSLEKIIQYYREWIVNYTHPVEPRINTLTREGLASEASSTILQLRRDEVFRGMVRYLEEQLMIHGVDLCTGSTLNRHLYHMVLQENDFWKFMHDIDVRIALDPIADEIMKRSVEKPDDIEAENDNEQDELALDE